MQEREARQMRQTWGDKPCVHPAFDQLMLGNLRDGYVCLRCGHEFTPGQRDQILATRKNSLVSASEPLSEREEQGSTDL